MKLETMEERLLFHRFLFLPRALKPVFAGVSILSPMGAIKQARMGSCGDRGRHEALSRTHCAAKGKSRSRMRLAPVWHK